jgi:catechol 2,3-dioxygenase
MLTGIVFGVVCLQVADLQRSLEFYQRLGFRVGLLEPPAAILTAADRERAVLLLWERPGTRPLQQAEAGLYHVAFRLPSESFLAAFLAFVLQDSLLRSAVEGASDHLVSQALYLRDPDGNGVEIYADREPRLWPHIDGEILMDTRPLDIPMLLQHARMSWEGMPAGTRIGHLHFRVLSLLEAEEFLHGLLGFAVTLRRYPGARFFAADGYHHHLGTNIWGHPRRLPAAEAAGVRFWSLGISEPGAWTELIERLRPLSRTTVIGSWLLLQDPWGSTLLVSETSALPTTPEAVWRMFNQCAEVFQ